MIAAESGVNKAGGVATRVVSASNYDKQRNDPAVELRNARVPGLKVVLRPGIIGGELRDGAGHLRPLHAVFDTLDEALKIVGD